MLMKAAEMIEERAERPFNRQELFPFMHHVAHEIAGTHDYDQYAPAVGQVFDALRIAAGSSREYLGQVLEYRRKDGTLPAVLRETARLLKEADRCSTL